MLEVQRYYPDIPLGHNGKDVQVGYMDNVFKTKQKSMPL